MLRELWNRITAVTDVPTQLPCIRKRDGYYVVVGSGRFINIPGDFSGIAAIELWVEAKFFASKLNSTARKHTRRIPGN